MKLKIVYEYPVHKEIDSTWHEHFKWTENVKSKSAENSLVNINDKSTFDKKCQTGSPFKYFRFSSWKLNASNKWPFLFYKQGQTVIK